MSIRRVVPIEEVEWRVEPTPAWVRPSEVDWNFSPDGEWLFAYLLLDEQQEVARQSAFSRHVRRLLSHTAVQALSQVEIQFEPAAQRLLVHELAVWRQGEDGAWSKHSEVNPDAFLLRQREQGLEQQMLNGHVSLVALLEDVRVGDAIDLAWTLAAREPPPGQHFTTFFAFGWGVPVARGTMSLHQDPDEAVRWRVHVPDGVQVPSERIDSGAVTWEVESPRPLEVEPNAPGSSWPCPVLDISGWSSWAEVASFFATLWRDALGEGAESSGGEAARLRAEHRGDAVVREAIRFVQEDVRYLSVDFGHGAGMVPSGAGAVLRRRFGDCKDKAVLLTALLRALGFEAHPMLVAANWTTALWRTQPSSGVFSHAIVSLAAGDKRRFVDPTLIGQGGDLDHLTPPPYGCGLEIREGADALTTLPEMPAAELTVTETFELDRSQRDGSVEQVMHARGPMADDIRAMLMRQGTLAFSKSCAEVLQTHFPALIPSDEAAVVTDDLEANAIEVRARHRLPTWGAVGQKPPPSFQYGAHGLLYAIEAIEGPRQRRLPWALRHPTRAEHRILVRGKCVRRVAPETHSQGGPGFRYACNVMPEDKGAAFTYRWETTQDEIRPPEWPEYCQKREQAFGLAGANVPTTGRRAPVWGWVVVALGLVALWIAAGYVPNDVERTSAARARPEGVDRSMAAARLAMKQGDHRTAASVFEEIADHYAGSLGFQSMRAEAAIRSGQLNDASLALAAARQIDPDNARVMFLQAHVAELQGHLLAARNIADQVLEKDPDNIETLRLRARVAQQMGDTAQALGGWRRILSLRPSHPDALLNYALLLWGQGEYERADAAIQDVVRSQPAPSPPLEVALSSYLDATGRWREAVGPAQRAADLAPDNPTFANRYAMALLQAGDEDTAFDIAQRMLERFPRHPLALSAVAISASATERTEMALDAYDAWREAEPGNPSALANHGYFLHRIGRSHEARGLLEQGTRDFPGSGIVWLNYATVLADQGEAESAASARRKADALMPARQRTMMIR